MQWWQADGAWATVGEGKGIVRAISVSGPVSLNPIKFSAWLILESALKKRVCSDKVSLAPAAFVLEWLKWPAGKSFPETLNTLMAVLCIPTNYCSRGEVDSS